MMEAKVGEIKFAKVPKKGDWFFPPKNVVPLPFVDCCPEGVRVKYASTGTPFSSVAKMFRGSASLGSVMAVGNAAPLAVTNRIAFS
jgi:hypothetical protein